MKKTVAVLLIMFSAGVLAAQQLPNSSFENWTLKDEYIEPDGWVSTNAYAYFGAPETCYPFEDAHTGKWSAKLETRIDPIKGDTLPALMLVGNDYNFFGIGYKKRPTAYSFYYKHNLKDTAAAVMILSKWNAVKNKRDTIGIALTYFIDSTSVFKQRILPITYLSNAIPDTCIAAFASTLRPKPWPGNYLVVDDLQITGFPTGVEETIQENELKIYPNPAATKIVVDGCTEIVSVSIWTISGKLVAHGAGNQLDVTALDKAMYIVQAIQADGKIINTRLLKE